MRTALGAASSARISIRWTENLMFFHSIRTRPPPAAGISRVRTIEWRSPVIFRSTPSEELEAEGPSSDRADRKMPPSDRINPILMSIRTVTGP
jgi:hypothetical protein